MSIHQTPDSAAPDISIVLVNMNASDMLKACLQSIRSTQGSLSLHVILIDNASTDNSRQVAAEEWPDILLLAQERNIGYVKANNLGLARATGRKTLLLNNDTVLLAGCIQEMANYLDSHAEVGAVSAQILNPDGTDQGVSRSFPSFMNGLFGRRSVLTKAFPNNPWTKRYMLGRDRHGDEPFECEFLSTACLMMRTEQALEIGGMDEEFTHYWCDAELCMRVIRYGLRVFCVPRSKILHFEGQGGSNKTWRRRLKSTITFHKDAYLAYIKVHQLPRWHPWAILAAFFLSLRVVCLASVQCLLPGRSMTSGGKASRTSARPTP